MTDWLSTIPSGVEAISPDFVFARSAKDLLLAAESCCHSLHQVQLAYNALERFTFLDPTTPPEDMPLDRAEFGALLSLVNEAAMKRIDDTWAAVRQARGVKEPAPGW